MQKEHLVHFILVSRAADLSKRVTEALQVKLSSLVQMRGLGQCDALDELRGCIQIKNGEELEACVSSFPFAGWALRGRNVLQGQEHDDINRAITVKSLWFCNYSPEQLLGAH